MSRTLKPYPCCDHCPPSHDGGSSLYPCNDKACAGAVAFPLAVRRPVLTLRLMLALAVALWFAGMVVAQVGSPA